MCLTLIRTLKDTERQSSNEGYAVFDGDRCVGHIMRARQAPAGSLGSGRFSRVICRARVIADAATQQQAMMALEAAWAELKNLLTMRAQPRIGG